MNFLKNLTKKKAIFLTLSLVLLALVLLSLSTIFLEQKRNENFITQAEIDRVTNLDLSVQKAITELFVGYGETSVEVEEDKVIIQEQMPADYSVFEEKINYFKDFVEENLDTLTIDTTNINTMELELAPQPITYEHDLINEKAIINNIGLLDTVEVNFTFEEVGVSACPISWTGNDGSELILKIIAYNPINFGEECESQKTIDISDTITAEIGTLGKVEVDRDILEIIKQGTNPFTVKTTLELPADIEIVSIKMPEIVTNVSLLDVRIIGEARFITS